jgi:hypothetical protein
VEGVGESTSGGHSVFESRFLGDEVNQSITIQASRSEFLDEKTTD